MFVSFLKGAHLHEHDAPPCTVDISWIDKEKRAVQHHSHIFPFYTVCPLHICLVCSICSRHGQPLCGKIDGLARLAAPRRLCFDCSGLGRLQPCVFKELARPLSTGCARTRAVETSRNVEVTRDVNVSRDHNVNSLRKFSVRSSFPDLKWNPADTVSYPCPLSEAGMTSSSLDFNNYICDSIHCQRVFLILKLCVNI